MEFPALPSLTGPLPRRWHRITWRRKAFIGDAPPFHVVTSDITSVTLLRLSLEKDPEVITESITVDDWSAWSR